MSEQDINAVYDLLGEVNNLLESMPEGAEVFQRLRTGELTADEAVRKLAELAQSQGLINQLRAASQKMESLVPGGPLDPSVIRKAGRPVAMKTSTGINQLNPVYEASIAERVAIDGDAPELRSGPLPEEAEARPAVPVVTTSRDPVIIGLMLERASNEVKHQLLLATKAHRELCQKLLTEAEQEAVQQGRNVTTALALVEKNLPPVPTGVSGYEAGQLPVPRIVEPPSPHVTAVLDEATRRVACFKTLATTQGKVSATPVIEAAIRNHLMGHGISLRLGPPDKKASRDFDWSVQCFGPDDLSDNFNPIQVAITHLEAQCLTHAQSKPSPDRGWAVAVNPVNDIASRRFGWVARIGE